MTIDRQTVLEMLRTEVAESPGASARELKRAIGVDRSLINSVLYSHSELFSRVRDRPPRWYLTKQGVQARGVKQQPSDTAELDAWARCGISQSAAADWRSLAIADARVAALWDELETEPEDALRLMRAGLGPAEASDFLDAGIALADAMEWAACSMRRGREVADWRTAGFGPAEAQRWYELGFGADEAREWADAGKHPGGWQEGPRPLPISLSDLAEDPATVRWDLLDLDESCVHRARIGACEACASRRPQLVFYSGGGRAFHAFPACEALHSGQSDVRDRRGQVEWVEPTFRGSARLAQRDRRPCRACRPEG